MAVVATLFYKGEVVGLRPTGCMCNLSIIRNCFTCYANKGEVVGLRPIGCMCNLPIIRNCFTCYASVCI